MWEQEESRTMKQGNGSTSVSAGSQDLGLPRGWLSSFMAELILTAEESQADPWVAGASAGGCC